MLAMEQATAAAANLKSEAREPAQLVGRFDIGEGAPARTAQPARPSPARDPIRS